MSIAFPARFPPQRNAYAERTRELLMLECEQLQAADETPFAAPIADLQTSLVQMLQPPLLHPNAATNPLRELERSFENAFAELSTHCGVAEPARLPLFSFFHRLEHFEKQKPA